MGRRAALRDATSAYRRAVLVRSGEWGAWLTACPSVHGRYACHGFPCARCVRLGQPCVPRHGVSVAEAAAAAAAKANAPAAKAAASRPFGSAKGALSKAAVSKAAGTSKGAVSKPAAPTPRAPHRRKPSAIVKGRTPARPAHAVAAVGGGEVAAAEAAVAPAPPGARGLMRAASPAPRPSATKTAKAS